MFAPHNLIRDAPFTKLDLITCRNLLIYFQPHAQKTVLTLFHFALKPGGFLFLGSSESPGGLLDEFDTIDEHAKIYRKRRDIGLPRDLKLPLPRSGTLPRAMRRRRCRAAPASTRSCWRVYDRLLDRFMPPSFLVDEHGQLVDSFGGVESLLKVKRAAPVAEPARHARATICGPWSPARCTACAAMLESVRYPASRCPATAGTFALIAEPLRDGARRADPRPDLAGRRGRPAAPPVLVPPFADVPGAGARRPRRARRCAAACRAISMQRARRRARLHQGEPAGGDRGARDRERGAAGDQRGAGRRRTRSCRARTRSCTRSTRSSTPSTPSTRRRTSSCRSSTTTSSTC